MPINSPRAGCTTGRGGPIGGTKAKLPGKGAKLDRDRVRRGRGTSVGGLKPELENGEGASPCMVGARHKKGMQKDERVRGTAIKRAK